jgi:hypothetical protein
MFKQHITDCTFDTRAITNRDEIRISSIDESNETFEESPNIALLGYVCDRGSNSYTNLSRFP